jgi:hypothetical protein
MDAWSGSAVVKVSVTEAGSGTPFGISGVNLPPLGLCPPSAMAARSRSCAAGTAARHPAEPVLEGGPEQSRHPIRATHPMPAAVARHPTGGGINALLFFVGVPTIEDMRTARERKEANTVEGSRPQLETQLRHARRPVARCSRNYPWSQPSRAIMPAVLGTSYAFGTGQVPV